MFRQKSFGLLWLYNPPTRAILPTNQKYPAVNNKRENLKINNDGSINLYFGTKAPKGYQNHPPENPAR